MTDLSNAGVFTGKKLGFAPCTPQACMEILDYYGIDDLNDLLEALAAIKRRKNGGE